jgi:mannose-6-phosphate isomerase-like protein (cupin superfamily)
MLTKTEYKNVRPYTTKDGSLIRELMHPDTHGNSMQSIAEATVEAGSSTVLHRHHRVEELYHVIEGFGVVIVGSEQCDVTAGDTICIPPGTRHRIKNIGEKSLKILCCCSPAYSHDDTELLE